MPDEQPDTTPFLGVNGDQINKLLPFKLEGNIFSFRKKPNEKGSINICPSSMRGITVGAVYDRDVSISSQKDGLTFSKILDNLPAVQIREYAQDARLVQIQNAFKAFKDGWSAIRSLHADASLWKKIAEFVKALPEKIYQGLGKTIQADTGALKYTNGFEGNDKGYVLDIPFALYYQMMSTKTTGYYTIPYSGKLVDQSNGSVGWDTKHGFSGVSTTNNSLIGTAINFLGKNIRFNTTPTWGGNNTNDFPQIEVQFDLFNDSEDSAVNNFIFINNIIPKNRFLQWAILQHNPCVYDVKIEGYGRFFMCSGNMQCDYGGISRVPPKSVIDKIVASSSLGFKTQDILDNKIIRIPDIYKIKISLQSLLPNSFNNYLLRYTGNLDMQEGKNYSDMKDLGKEIQNSIENTFNTQVSELSSQLFPPEK